MTTEAPTHYDYFKSVRNLADDIVNSVCDHEADPWEALQCATYQTDWDVYSYNARFCLLYSPNENELFERGYDISEVESVHDLRCRAAAVAIQADVCEELQIRGYDLNDDADSWREVRDDSGEE